MEFTMYAAAELSDNDVQVPKLAKAEDRTKHIFEDSSISGSEDIMPHSVFFNP